MSQGLRVGRVMGSWMQHGNGVVPAGRPLPELAWWGPVSALHLVALISRPKAQAKEGSVPSFYKSLPPLSRWGMEKSYTGLIHGYLAAVLPSPAKSLAALHQPGEVWLRLGERNECGRLNPTPSFLFTEFQGFPSSVRRAVRSGPAQAEAMKIEIRKKKYIIAQA